MNALTEHYLDVDGVSTQYYTEGSGEPVLCLPGFLSVWVGSSTKYPTLLDHFQVIGVNWPGVNKSEKLNRPHTIENYAEFLLAFIAKSDIPIRKIVASSISCLTCLYALQLNPGAFSRLVLISPTDNYRHLWYVTLFFQITDRIGRRATLKLGQSIVNSRLLTGRLLQTYSTTDSQYVARYQENARSKIAVDVSYEILRSVFSRKWTELYERTKIPALMVVGDRDRIVRLQDAKRIASMNPNAKLLVLHGEHHQGNTVENTNLRASEMLKMLSAN